MRSYNDLDIDYQGGDLECCWESLDSLEGCPEYVTGEFRCDINNLSSLIGGPQRVDGDYDCSENNLTNLVGCASYIGDTLYFSNTNITSLVGIHKIIKSCNEIAFNFTSIKEGGIGLLLIDNLTNITSNIPVFKII